MARAIKLSQIGDYAKDQYEKLLRAAVLETDSLLKQASPVKSGRFRASWQVGENAAPGNGKPPGNYPSQPPIERIGYSQEQIGNVYSVHNNLPYAEKLADGSSQQATPGWVARVAKDVQTRVKEAAARIGRDS
jgi:hypothetical protein